MEAFELFDRYADWYVEQHMNVSAFQPSLDYILVQFSHKHTLILDVACGPGNLSKYIQERIPESQVIGIDLAPKMIELAKKHNPKGEFYIKNITEIDQFQERFDLVLFGFCFPYCDQATCSSLFQKSTHLLTKNALVYVSFIEGQYCETGLQRYSKVEEIQQFFYSKEQIEQIAYENGFTCVHSHAYASMNAGKKVTDIVLIFKLT